MKNNFNNEKVRIIIAVGNLIKVKYYTYNMKLMFIHEKFLTLTLKLFMKV